MYTFNFSTQEAEAGQSLWVWGHFHLYSEFQWVSLKKKKKNVSAGRPVCLVVPCLLLKKINKKPNFRKVHSTVFMWAKWECTAHKGLCCPNIHQAPRYIQSSLASDACLLCQVFKPSKIWCGLNGRYACSRYNQVKCGFTYKAYKTPHTLSLWCRPVHTYNRTEFPKRES